jgi:lipoprotein-releasing system permease protein
VTPFEKTRRVYAARFGEPAYLGDSRHGIIVGCDLLNERRADGNFNRYVARGADVALTLVPLSPTGNPTGEPPVKLPLRYVDDSRTGIYEIDSMNVYVDFDMLQHRLAMDPQQRVDGSFTKARANQLLVGLQDGVDLNAARDQISVAWKAFHRTVGPDLTDADFRALDLVSVSTWEDLQRPLIAAVEKEKVLVTILFGLISMVAIVLIGCIFYMIVEKKTRDIGILKALGASGRGVASLFIVYAAAVGVVGSILGTAIGTVFVWNVNTIQDFLARLHPQLRVWSPDIYSFDKIPEVVKPEDAIWVAVIAVVSSMLGSLIPARIAGRVWPVKALRYE